MMINFDELLSLPIFNNSPLSWLVAVTVAAGVFALLLAVRRAVRFYQRRVEQAGAGALLQIPMRVLSRTTLVFFVVLALFAGLRALELGSTSARVSATAITIALFWQAGIWSVATASAWLDRKRHRSSAFGSIGIIGVIINGVIWSFVVLLTLDNLGVDLTALVAGLGIGGIAVALAVQNIFGGLFASEAQADTRFDRSHFAAHGAASLDFETVYYVRSPDYNRHMDIQQAINLRLDRDFARLGIEFAYPTQKVFVASMPMEQAA